MTGVARKMEPPGLVNGERHMDTVAPRMTCEATCLLIDDHETLRIGVAGVLGNVGITTIAETECARCAVQLDVEPDLIVVDLQYGGERAACRAVQGAEAVALVAARWPRARIVVYTSSCCDRCAVASAAAGSHGHVRKVEGSAVLVDAARTVLDGGTYVPAWLARLIERAEKAGHPFGLTDRQLSVLQQVARGRTQQQVARTLGLTVDTVKEHMAALRTRMRATSTLDAVRIGAQAGLVSGFTPPAAVACSCWTRP